MRNTIALAGLLAAAGIAQASDPLQAYVTRTTWQDGKLLVETSAPEAPAGLPACATSENWHYVVTNAQLREAVAEAQRRYLYVTLAGTGSCSENIETLRFMRALLVE